MIQDHLNQIVLIGAAAAVVMGLFRYMYKLFRTWFRFIDEWNGSEDKPGIPARLDFIESELRPNHGSSIKDKIDKLEDKIDFIYQSIIAKK